ERHDFQVVPETNTRRQAAVHLPLVLCEYADERPFDDEIGRSWDANREPIRIGARIGRVERPIARRKAERAVEVTGVEQVERRVHVARTKFQIVVAALSWEEPGERLIHLVSRIL